MLVESFTISQGQPSVQGFFLEWTQNATGFDWKNSFQNFLNANAITKSNTNNSWSFLSLPEQQFLADKYRHIALHTFKGNSNVAILDEIEAQMQGLFYAGSNPNIDPLKLPDMPTSVAELRVRAKELIKSSRLKSEEDNTLNQGGRP